MALFEAASVATPELDIGYEVSGAGTPVILLHGFPYDVRCYDAVVPLLVAAGFQAFVPYLRGFGPTRFRRDSDPRSGEQAAVAHDAHAFADALGLGRPLIAGFDWGGRAAVAAAALWPDRFAGLVAMGGYTIYDIAAAPDPVAPRIEQFMWYQYYFATERGRRGLTANRAELCALLWDAWSPRRAFDPAQYARTAASFDNPDFVEVSLHSYRHRLGFAPGDPQFAAIEARLAARPPVRVPSIVLHSGAGLLPPPGEVDPAEFTALVDWRAIPGAGHNLPDEAPEALAGALIALRTAVDGA